MLSTEHNKTGQDDRDDISSFAGTLPVVTSTTLLNSVHLQFLAGCFGLGTMLTEGTNYTQLYHYQVGTIQADNKIFNPFSWGTDFRRQNLTSKVDHHTERVKYF